MLFPCVWLLPKVMMWPSGSARATARVPTAPEAPASLRTITLCPSVIESSWATILAMASVGPPAG